MYFYVYMLYRVKDYSCVTTQFYESLSKVGKAQTLEEAMEIASRLAFEDDEPGSRLTYTENKKTGGYFDIETLGGVVIDTVPLPHHDTEYVVIPMDIGELIKKYYTEDDLSED